MTRHNALRMLSTKRPFTERSAIAEAAVALGCTAHFVRRWPDELPRRIADRVIAHCFRLEVAGWLAQGKAVADQYVDAAALKHPDDQHGQPVDDELEDVA